MHTPPDASSDRRSHARVAGLRAGACTVRRSWFESRGGAIGSSDVPHGAHDDPQHRSPRERQTAKQVSGGTWRVRLPPPARCVDFTRVDRSPVAVRLGTLGVKGESAAYFFDCIATRRCAAARGRSSPDDRTGPSPAALFSQTGLVPKNASGGFCDRRASRRRGQVPTRPSHWTGAQAPRRRRRLLSSVATPRPDQDHVLPVRALRAYDMHGESRPGGRGRDDVERARASAPAPTPGSATRSHPISPRHRSCRLRSRGGD